MKTEKIVIDFVNAVDNTPALADRLALAAEAAKALASAEDGPRKGGLYDACEALAWAVEEEAKAARNEAAWACSDAQAAYWLAEKASDAEERLRRAKAARTVAKVLQSQST